MSKFACYLVICGFFFEKFFKANLKVSNSLDPDQPRQGTFHGEQTTL